jgi:hypothetical protein
MALFIFEPDKEVIVYEGLNKKLLEHPPMSYAYISVTDEWHIRDPKTLTWINFRHEGVPEIYRTQVLLLTAAYPD